MVQRAVASGYSIGSHSFTNPLLNQVPLSEVFNQVQQTDAELASQVCIKPTVFYPPLAATSADILDLTKRMGKWHILIVSICRLPSCVRV